jgi:hypothetical protein
MNKPEKPIGLTKNSGWQFGLRKTFPYPQEYLWAFMFSDEGLNIWLGTLEKELEVKKTYKTKEGIEGFVRVYIPFSHVRMNWKKKNWKNASILQVRVIGNHEKTMISFHQEKLLNANQREEMKLYWNEKMTEIKNTITAKHAKLLS